MFRIVVNKTIKVTTEYRLGFTTFRIQELEVEMKKDEKFKLITLDLKICIK